MLPAGSLRSIRSLPKPFDYAKEQLEQARWKWKEASNQFEKDGWYAFLRRQGNLPSPILPWERLEPEDDEGYEGTGLTQQDADFIKTLVPESVQEEAPDVSKWCKDSSATFPCFWSVVTDRNIAFGELYSGTRSRDYSVGAIELFLTPDGKGCEGTVLPACKLKIGKKTQQIEIETYQNPWKLMNLMISKN